MDFKLALILLFFDSETQRHTLRVTFIRSVREGNYSIHWKFAPDIWLIVATFFHDTILFYAYHCTAISVITIGFIVISTINCDITVMTLISMNN